jgi:hypothetical protein
VSAEEPQSDAVADAPCGHSLANRVDDADDLVTGDYGSAGIGPNPLYAKEVAVAHPAGEHSNANVSGVGFDDLAFH